MQAKTHEVTGISFAVIASAVQFGLDINRLPYGTAMIAGATLGSLMPDIDHGGSRISRKHEYISAILGSKLKHRGITHSLLANLVVMIVCYSAALLLHLVYNDMAIGKLVVSGMMVLIFCILYNYIYFVRKMVNRISKEGRLIVSLLVAGIAYYCAEQLVDVSLYLAFGITLGYFSHLFADMCTVSGLAILQPFNDRVFKLANFHTGENEGIFRAACVAITIFVLIWRCF